MGRRQVLRTVYIRRIVELEGVIKSLTVRNLTRGCAIAGPGRSMCVGSDGLGQALCAATAGGRSIRATLGARRSCAAARGADIAARCPYHAEHLIGETPTGATETAALPPKKLGQRGLSRWPGTFLTLPCIYVNDLPAMQTVNTDREHSKATEVTVDAGIGERGEAREDASTLSTLRRATEDGRSRATAEDGRPPTLGRCARPLRRAETHKPRKGNWKVFAYFSPGVISNWGCRSRTTRLRLNPTNPDRIRPNQTKSDQNQTKLAGNGGGQPKLINPESAV
jgi:hypothetical protein